MGLSIQEMAITKASTIACAIKDRLRSRDATLGWSWIVVTSKTIPLGKWEMKVYYMYIHYIYIHIHMYVWASWRRRLLVRFLVCVGFPYFLLINPRCTYIFTGSFELNFLMFSISIFISQCSIPLTFFYQFEPIMFENPSALHSIALAG